MVFLSLLFLSFAFQTAESSVLHLRRLEKLDTMGLISAWGFIPEDHRVVTEDGYILRLHRMLRKNTENGGSPFQRPPVLLMHGLMGRSDMWVLRGPGKDLAFLLLDAGYDVWLGNVRGNNYCKNHVSLNTTTDPFWEYSFHEMGHYDLPAMMDYILGSTNTSQLFYVGHSMGTTMFFAMAATRPEYNKKVRGMFALAPVAFMSDYPPFFKQLASNKQSIYVMLKNLRMHEVPPKMPWLADTCRDGSALQPTCIQIMFNIMGQDYKQFNTSMLPMILEHISSTNLRTLYHYAQVIESGRFVQLDLGSSMNLRTYGSAKAPEYNLSQVTAPVSLHFGANDKLSSQINVMKLAKRLPNLVNSKRVPYQQFNHIDFLWANDAPSLLYKDILRLINKL